MQKSHQISVCVPPPEEEHSDSPLRLVSIRPKKHEKNMANKSLVTSKKADVLTHLRSH